MSVLLDTNVFLWAAGIDGRLAECDEELLTAWDGPTFISSVSAWEIAIKWSKGRLTLPERPETLVENIISTAELTKLTVSFQDTYAIADLRHPRHKDPFDRLIVAQAKRNGLRLMTSDARLAEYGVEIIHCKTKR